MRSVARARAVAFAALALLLSCDGATEERNETVLADLRAHERAWQVSGITSYSMVILRRCAGCAVQLPGPVLVVVDNGVVTSQTNADSGAPVAAAARPLVPDVEGLFDELKRTMAGSWRTLSTAYDSTYGYPTHIHVDFDLRRTADDLTIDITEFTRR